MFIYVLDILLVLVQTFEIQASEEYYELSSKVSWDEAINLKNCDIAQPKITLNPSKYAAIIEHNLGNNEVWVGYFTMMTVFEYIGCLPIPATQKPHMLPSEEYGPGVCYTLCRPSGTDTVGISEHKCFCLKKEQGKNFNYSGCHAKCDKPIGLVCGGESYMSVYRANINATNHLTRPNLDKRYCLKIERSLEDQDSYATKKSWEKCDSDLKTICLNDNYHQFHTIHGANNVQSFPWINSTELHMKECGLPINYADIVQIKTEAIGPAWTGVIRSEVRYTHSELADSRQHIEYGYLKKMNQETVLSFENEGTRTRAVLCRKLSTGSTTDNVNNNKTSTSRKGSNVLIPVVVSVVIILVMMAVAIVILKRRKTIPDFCKRSAHRKESGNNCSEIDLSSKTIKNVNRVNSNQSHDHCSVTAHNDYLDIDDASIVNDDNSYTHTYFVLEEDERKSDNENTAYNITGSSEQTRDTETDNVYNKLKLNTTTTYDHARIKKEIGVNKSEDTYDTAAIAALRLKAQASQSSDGIGEIDEDDYSHINNTISENNKVDNVYGQPNQFENGTVGSGEIHFNGRDAYSHVHNNRPDKCNPDNL